jgi:hypothetical protein
MTEQTRYDAIHIKATVSPDGFIYDRPVITRTGIFEYKDKTGKVLKEYRPPEEVFHEDSLKSILGIPVTDTHRGLVSPDNVNGIIGTVLTTGTKDGDSNVVADVVIHQAKRLGSKRELSLGYRALVVDVPGVTPEGQRYDSKQTNIRYNHLAVVEVGRAGNARLRLDSNEATSLVLEEEMADTPKLVSIRLDSGLEYFGQQEVAQAFAKMGDDLKKKTSDYEKILAERDTLKQQHEEVQKLLKGLVPAAAETAKLPELATMVADSVKEMPAKLAARSELESKAKQLDIKFDGKSDRELRELIVMKIRGDSIKFDGKSDDYVTSAYDLALGMDVDKSKKIGEQRVSIGKQADHTATKLGGASAARARMVNTIRAGR